MPLPTNNSRPAIPYNPVQVLPNYDRYDALGNFPPTAQQLDGDFNRVIDLINVLANAINNTAAGIFPGADDPLNANMLATTDGAGNVSWTLINAQNIDVNAVQTIHIQNAAITMPKIQVQAVGTNQLADGAVTTIKLADLAVSNAKLQPIPLTSTRSSGTPCIVVGQTNGSHYREMTLNANPWGIVTMGNDGNMNVYNLASVWYYSNVTYDGSKLTDQSVTLGKITVGVNNAGVVGSADGTLAASFMSADNQNYGILSGGGGNNVAFRVLTNVWNNSPINTASGTILLDSSVPYSKIDPTNNPLKNVKFFDAGYQSNNNNHDFYLLKQFTGIWNGTGTYDFTTTSTYRTSYWMPFVTFDNGLYCYYVSNRTQYSFRINVTNNAGNVATDAPFSIMILGYE